MYTVPSSGKVEWVDKAERSGTSSTTGGKVSNKVAHKLGVLVNTAEENLLVLVFEGKVQSLGREVSNDVGEVTTPEAEESLFFWNAHKTIYHTWKINVFICNSCSFCKNKYIFFEERVLFYSAANERD